ncbi:hypothetical protein NPIL_533311, partial [Nephila pilipes]
MGTGCSSVENVRSKIRRNIALQSRRSQKGNLKGALKSEEETESREEDDELAALSPISDTTKVGSGGTRGLSAASTVLPGTSI